MKYISKLILFTLLATTTPHSYCAPYFFNYKHPSTWFCLAGLAANLYALSVICEKREPNPVLIEGTLETDQSFKAGLAAFFSMACGLGVVTTVNRGGIKEVPRMPSQTFDEMMEEVEKEVKARLAEEGKRG